MRGAGEKSGKSLGRDSAHAQRFSLLPKFSAKTCPSMQPLAPSGSTGIRALGVWDVSFKNCDSIGGRGHIKTRRSPACVYSQICIVFTSRNPRNISETWVGLGGFSFQNSKQNLDSPI